ncbi:MAG: hypothetical protein IIW48_00140 [Clostridia bacterium]|nr:hypothetical protein [Clostridia bacterium]
MYCEQCGRELNEGELCNCKEQQSVCVAEPVPPKKRMTKGKIIAIIAASAVVSFALWFGVSYFVTNYIFSFNSDLLIEIEEKYPDEDFIAESGVMFTNGVCVNGVYRNDWLGLQLACPEGYEEVDEQGRAEYDTEDSKCVVYFMAEDGDEISIGIGDGTYTSPKNYAAYYHTNMQTWLEDQYLSVYNETYMQQIEIKNVVNSFAVGGRDYLVSATYATHATDGDLIVYCLLCTQLDDQLVEILIVTDTLDECTALINRLQGIK